MTSLPHQDQHRHHSMLSQAGHRLLRKCRSEKKLRISPPMHVRKDSTASTSSFSSEASTAASISTPTHHHHSRSPSDHERQSSDWDPLRCHPPLDVDRSPYIPTPRQAPLQRGSGGVGHDDNYDDDDDDFDLQTPVAEHDLDDIINHYGMTALRPPPPLANRRPLFQRMKTAEMDIHEGFDFGFAAANRDGHRHDHLAARTTPPRPLTSSTMGSDHSGTSWLNLDCSRDSVPSELLPSPRSRRPPSTQPDTPAHLLKRGEWKRRGIVFVSETDKVTEEDCFEIP
ncbi:hypothetical protein MCOR27_004651 [Pyricularia oryzae]|uniref:Uncharacterized protein n=1 Tax=Pyricularia grisea TaxID=148305 RepID=A0ABQ8NYF5_PYRGI|nr:hypothetical protein MCOR02_000760 [Pyricularia oryzae]KAI6303891.1 hypothetical protein MCOR33_001060 [Pyricularia grisea]KAI6261737.1 hypothetical protein MCOR19_002067 [Pyricularia oryzae]KAI6280564.1 hypothetical protein MCOR27_004651 [Pyricularia oryzae]KAI6281348.1 hypothetical protein MCOR26_003359 [Pyricularia oryzae]